MLSVFLVTENITLIMIAASVRRIMLVQLIPIFVFIFEFTEITF